MLKNAVNRADLGHVVDLTRSGKLWDTARWLVASKIGRVTHTWSDSAPPTTWQNLPWFQERINLKASGDAAITHMDYVASRHLGDGLLAVSLGCGDGAEELQWAATGHFAKIIGIDLTPGLIEAANESAAKSRYATITDFRVDNAETMNVPPNSLDAVIFEHALHHFKPVRGVLERVQRWLRPDGLVLVNEFVGPTRFQWTERQLEVANALVALLPRHLRRQVNGRLRSRVVAPSKLAMRMDPSEAIESDQIVPLLDEFFERVELRPLGGTLGHLVFARIAQNFSADDQDARRWANVVFTAEDLLMDAGEIESDFIVGVWRRGADGATGQLVRAGVGKLLG
jgi:ubiquinone/menaquinone biosynthesis C-methylase UbiE